MMSLIYAVAFLCLFRINEVLKLEVRHFRLIDKKTGETEISPDFRTTSQGRGMNDLDLDYVTILIPFH
jgi:hypothetical protein